MYRRPGRPAPQQQQLAQLPEVSEVANLVVQGATDFARRYKYFTGYYLLGLCMIALVTSGTIGQPLSRPKQQAYQEILSSIDVQAEYDLQDRYWRSQNRYDRSRGWFGQCDSVCQRLKQQRDHDKYQWELVRKEGNARMRDAKAIAGLSSQVGITEMTDSFWGYFASGNRFAKRQTGWDIFWMFLRSIGSRGRDETMAQYVVKIIMMFLFNLSLGLVFALGGFVFGLWSIVSSYQPNPIIAVTVFLLAAAAAMSFVITYLLTITGVAFFGVYGTVKFAEQSQRLQNQRPNQRLHYD